MKRYNNKLNVVGNLIKTKRIAKHYTQTQLCNKLELLGINFSRNEIYRIENGKMTLKDFELIGFCMALDINLNELIDLIEC